MDSHRSAEILTICAVVVETQEDADNNDIDVGEVAVMNDGSHDICFYPISVHRQPDFQTVRRSCGVISLCTSPKTRVSGE
jgi:hypothetical protein